MGNVDAHNLLNPGKVRHSGTWGNLSVEFETITAAANVADVYRFFLLPAGSELVDAFLVTSANEAGTTIDFGYTTAVGGGTETDEDYFLNDADIGTAGVFRKNTVNPPHKLTEDAYITATVAGSAVTSTTSVTAVVFYRFVGL